MGFLDWLLSKEAEGSGVRGVDVRFDKLPAWIRGERGAKEKRILNGAGEHLRGIEDYLADVSHRLDEIKVKEPHETVPERFKKIIANSKPKYLKDMRELALDASPDGIDDYRKLNAYSEKLKGTLKELAKVNTGEGRYLTLAYGEEMEAIQKKAKLIQDELSKVEDLLRSDEALSKLGVVEDKAGHLTKLTGEAYEASSTAKACEMRLNALCGRLEKNAVEIRSTEESEEMRVLEEKKRLIEARKKEKEQIEEVVYSSLRSLDRVLKRYRKDCPDELSGALEAVLKDPVEYYFNAQDERTYKLLEKLGKAVASGVVEAKDAGKTLERIREAETRLGSWVKEEHARIDVEIAFLMDDASKAGVHEKLNALYNEKTLLESEHKSALKEKEKASAREKTLRAEKEVLRGELVEFLLREFNVRLLFGD